MTEAASDRFIARQIQALEELGLDDEALAREEAMLRQGFALAGWLAALAHLEAA
jgi:hypothetical protein